MRPLSLLSWIDKKRSRFALTGLVVAAVAAATLSSAPAVAAAPASSGPSVRVIVRALPGGEAVLPRDIAEAGGQITDYIPLVTSAAADVPAGAVTWLSAQPGIVEVTPDGPVQLSSATYSPTTGAGSLYSVEQALGVDQAWNDGYTGSGVGVALIDTGVTPVEGLDGSGQIVNGPDLSFDNSSSSLRYLDANGHGTFMAGIIAGRDPGAVSGDYAGDTTDFLGVAPDSHIVNVKVGSFNGSVDVSQVLAAIDWVVMHRDDEGFNIRVLNLSFGTDSSQSYLVDPLAYAAEAAWHNGIVVVAAAGNQGSTSNRLADPAIDPYIIAVGASQGSGSSLGVAPYSSAGSRSRRPDVVAPGTSIVSLDDPGSVIDAEYGSTAEVGGRFFLGSGTSEATAVVSGLAALLIQEHPSATPDQIKALLTSTATPIKGASSPATSITGVSSPATSITGVSSLVAGHGQVSASGAVQASLTTTTQSFAESTGTGTLQGARGSLQVTLDGVALSGEQDIFGAAVDTASLATVEGYADSWNAGSWNGNVWSGSYWVWSPTVMDWQYVAWTGDAWNGTAWSSVPTASGTWTGVSWSGVSWSGVSWSGVSWSGVSWSGVSWSDDGWASYTW